MVDTSGWISKEELLKSSFPSDEGQRQLFESAGVRPGIMGDAYAAQLCFHRNSGLPGEYFDPLGSLQVPNEDESCRCFEKFQTRLGQEDTYCGCAGCSQIFRQEDLVELSLGCLLYTSPSPRDLSTSRMPSSA